MSNPLILSRRSTLALLLAGCASRPVATTSAQAAQSDGQKLVQVFSDSDEELLRLTPQGATARGDLRYADQFGDLITDDWVASYRNYLTRDEARINSVDRGALSAIEQMQYDVFAYNTRFQIQSYRSGAAQIDRQDLALDYLNGQQAAFPQFMAAGGGYPYNSTADYENALKMHEGYVLFLARAREHMRRGIARGHTFVRLVPERMIAQVRESIEAGLEDSPFLTPTANFPDAVAAADRERLTQAFRASIADKIIPAHRELLHFLESEYLPAARTGAPGLGAMPDGGALYAYYLQLYTTSTLSPDEIHTLGEAEVARVRAEMERTKARVGFRGSLQEFFTHLKTAPEFKFATREAYLDRFREIQSRLEPLLPRYFRTLARLPFEIRSVPAEIENTVPGAYYIPGLPDGSQPGVFYANTSNLPSRTSPIMTALFLHEAIPGHHFQSSIAAQDENLPAFLRFGWNAGYGEGWALYCERLGIEMGLYEDPYQYFGMLELEMFRATRLVIDTGLHAKGWSRDQAIAYMAENTSFDRSFIQLEIDRYIVTPGQATSYKVGELVLHRLRARAQQALGARFDLREFHEQVLATGALPLAVLEQKIDNWLGAPRS